MSKINISVHLKCAAQNCEFLVGVVTTSRLKHKCILNELRCRLTEEMLKLRMVPFIISNFANLRRTEGVAVAYFYAPCAVFTRHAGRLSYCNCPTLL